MVIRIHVLLFTLVFLIMAAAMARADSIVVTFTAFPAANDPVNTSASTGTFSFTTGLIPPGGGDVRDNVGLSGTKINFQWGRTLFTTANAGVAELEFDPSGALLSFVLGGKPGIYGLISAPASAVVDDFFASSFSGLKTSSIAYTNAGHAGILEGRLIATAAQAPVPEPTTMLLIVSGAALAVQARRRVRL